MSAPEKEHPDQALHTACDILEGQGFPETAKALDGWATNLQARLDALVKAAMAILQSTPAGYCTCGDCRSASSNLRSAIAAAKGGQ